MPNTNPQNQATPNDGPDRRRFFRQTDEGWYRAVLLDDRLEPIAEIAIGGRDASLGGIGALLAQPLDIGARVALVPHNGDARNTQPRLCEVRSCQPADGDWFRVGMTLRPLPAGVAAAVRRFIAGTDQINAA